MLEISGLTKTYGDHRVLTGVDLTVPRGTVLGLVGANGSGKTTLISIVAGLRPADSGRVTVAGIDALAHPRAAAAHLGLAPQTLGVYPTLTARANLESFAELAGLRRRAARARAVEVAAALDLEPQLDQRADRLSGGQQRRLHTGLAVLHSPDLLFLDEPTVGADVASRGRVLDLVARLAADGAAVVYTTHYLNELEQLDARVAVLDGGRIVEQGPQREVVARWAPTTVRLEFAGPPPELPGWSREPHALVRSERGLTAGTEAAAALHALGPAVRDLTGVQVAPADLESAYVALTGRSFTDRTLTEEPVDVPA